MKLQSPPSFLGVPWPGNPEVRFSKAELATFTRAADLLETLRAKLDDDTDTDIALAMYTLRDLVERGGLEL